MFQLLPCSRCQRTFSIRQEVSPLALLKCPNCGNQFRLGELFDALYEPWKVVEDPQGPSASGSLGNHEEDNRGALLAAANPGDPGRPSQVQEGDIDESATATASGPYLNSNFDLEVVDDASPLEVIDEQSPDDQPTSTSDDFLLTDDTRTENELAPVNASLEGGTGDALAASWPTFKSPVQEEHKRSRRHERSGLWSTLQVVLGGAAAIPVTLLLLWYVLGKDVAGAGPAVARYVPWIVPRQFHGYRAEHSPRAGIAPPMRGARPEKGDSRFLQLDNLPPTDHSRTDLLNSSESSASESSAGEPGAGEPNSSNGNLSEANGDDPLPGDDSVTGQADAPASTQKRDKTNSAIDRDLPMTNLFASLSGAKQKIAAWDEPFSPEEIRLAASDEDLKKKRIIALLDDLAQIGEQLARVSAEGSAIKLLKNDLRDVGRSIVGNADLEKWFHLAVMAQFNGLTRSTKGRVFLCKVGQLDETESSWHIKPSDDALSRLQLPTIEVAKRLAMQMKTGERLFLLGRMTRGQDANGKLESAESEDIASDKRSEGSQDSERSLESSAPEAELFQASFSHSL